MNIFFHILKIKKIPTLSWSSPNPLNFRPKLNTFFYLIIGLILFALGETLLITANQGVSPWTVLAQGISIKTGYSIGLSTFIISVSVLLLWIPLKHLVGFMMKLRVIGN